MKLDDRGIPIIGKNEVAAKEHPPNPCQLCTGTESTGKMSSWEWCQQFNTCAATIDWDMVYGR